jgi:hypothetical protein
MDKAHKPITTQYYTLSPKPFGIYLINIVCQFACRFERRRQCLFVAIPLCREPESQCAILNTSLGCWLNYLYKEVAGKCLVQYIAANTTFLLTISKEGAGNYVLLPVEPLDTRHTCRSFIAPRSSADNTEDTVPWMLLSAGLIVVRLYTYSLVMSS